MIANLIFTFVRLIFFLFLSVVIFYLPGLLILSYLKTKLLPLETLFLSFCTGFMLLILSATVWGLLGIRSLSLFLMVFLAIASVLKNGFSEIFFPFKELFKQKVLLGLILLGILIQGFINFPSGFRYGESIYFWSSQGHDGLWHVALMEEIKNHFPPQNPLYAGYKLTNYHYASDILMGEFYRFFPKFSSLDLYFRFFPVIFSLLIGLGAFAFTFRRWGEKAGYWAVFFTYCCGSFGYIVSLLRGGFLFTGETTFWASQGNTILGNPPHTVGIILLTAVATTLAIWQKIKDSRLLLLLSFLGLGLATVKVSSGLIMVLGIGMAGLYFFLFEKKISLLLAGIFLGISNFILLKIISPGAESFLIWQPLWFPRTMMVAKLGDIDWELRRQHYIWKNTWHSWLREASLEMEAILIFIVGNAGIRIVGLGAAVKKFKTIDSLQVFLWTVLAVSIGVVLFFIQKGIVFNLIQFIQIFLHFLGILAGVSVAYLLSRIKSRAGRFFLGLLFVFLAIPTALGNLFDFYYPGKGGPLAKVTPAEISALTWLKNNSSSDAVILTKPFIGNGQYRYPHQPWPISAWYSTPYVYVFSNRDTFLSGEEQLMITGYQTKEDLEAMKKFFKVEDLKYNKAFLQSKKIDFVYVRRDELEGKSLEGISFLKPVFANEESIIYKVENN
ncbi:MAG: hypothetical protein M1514_02740 [Patescibacteria group bacterium]|nr:hypothetical protein [Patescibacteria group bacterium]